MKPKLCKEYCKLCHQQDSFIADSMEDLKYIYPGHAEDYREDVIWSSDDEMQWEQLGSVFCLKYYDAINELRYKVADVYSDPPKWCKYAAEHVLAMQDETKLE